MSDDKTAERSNDLPDLSALQALIAKVIAIDLSSQSEQATREIVVNRIIENLGWDTLNPDEVAREHSVLGGKVDYCLRGPKPKRDLVLIEVKRVDTDLSEHQEQLLRYAFDAGAPLAVLTDGLLWWLYLPMADTSWEQRRFFSINFREQGATEAAPAIYRFLNRHGVIDGTCQEEAQREFQDQERDRRVRAALQEAWQRMLGDPQGLLRDLLAETVQEISGDVPDEEEIAEFLEDVSGGGNITGRELPAKPLRSRARRAPEHESERSSPTERSPIERERRSERKRPFQFSMVGIKVGAILTSRWDEETRCTVLENNKVEFKGKEMSLSAAALQAVHDRGKNWKAVSGPESWRYNGETLAALRERLSTED